MNTVLAQTSGLAAMASITLDTNVAPAAGDPAGGSSKPLGGSSQLTVGSLSFIASYSNWPMGEEAIAWSCSGVPGWALKYCAMCCRLGRPVAPSWWYTFQLTPASVSRSG